MPELPEVETLKRQLAKGINSQKILEIEVLREKSFRGEKGKAVNKKITEVGRRAKLLWLKLSPQAQSKADIYLLVHLKMTGQLVYCQKKGNSQRLAGGHPTADWVNKLPSKHTRVILFLEKGRLYFNDQRAFGWIKVLDEEEFKKEINKFGPDVTSKEFDKKYLKKILEASTRTVKLLLLDQSKVAGLGNIYVNDGLFWAKIHPEMRSNKAALDSQRVNRLFIGLKRIVGKGIKYQGASEANYVHLNGLGGSYQDHFLVYKKTGQKCSECGSIIKRIKLGGRGTYYCPNCQKKV